MSPVSASAFDVQAYVLDPVDLRPADLDLAAIAGLEAPVLDVLEHLWSVERGILDLLRDLLVTPTHTESRVTAFLNTWAFEQYWVAQSLAAVLESNGREPREPADTALGAALRTWDERFSPTIQAFRTNLLGEEIVAAHMSTGWLSTAVIDLAYARLAATEARMNPMCADLRRIKARHLAFYADDARSRLAGSAQARRLARRAVAVWDWPGTRYAGRSPIRPVLVTLFADPAAAAGVRAVDAAVGELPGLAGLNPVQRSLGLFAR